MTDDEPTTWEELFARWDWQTEARLTAHELDRFPWWDNFDLAANTLINSLEGAAQALEATMDHTPQERAAVVLYYRSQAIRIAGEMSAMQASRRPDNEGPAGGK